MNKLKYICCIIVAVLSQVSHADTSQRISCPESLISDKKSHALLGSYTLIEGEGEFETFALEANNSFSSWLHERPEFFDLHWQFEASSCEVVISGEPLPNAIRFRVVDKTDSSLTVQFLASETLEENEGFAIYQAL